jgi:hypothetical protein
MPEAFPVSGNIDPVSFPHLLVDLHRHGATGSLKVTGPVHPKALYFRGGRVLFGSSNDPRDQLGAILIESGRITRDQLDEVNAKVGPGNPLAKVLAESGFVNQRELGEAARLKVETILADVLSWDSGSFEFEDGVLPKGAVDLKLSTEKLLLAAVQRVSDRAFALRHLELATVFEPAPEGETALSEVRADVWPLLERLDGRRTLKDAIALTRMDEFEAAKIACAMLFLGIVRRKATSGQEVDLAEEAQSGFGEEEDAAMYTVPLTAVSVADLPSGSTGFAFSEAAPATRCRSRLRSRSPSRSPRTAPSSASRRRPPSPSRWWNRSQSRSRPSSRQRPRCCRERLPCSRWPTTRGGRGSTPSPATSRHSCRKRRNARPRRCTRCPRRWRNRPRLRRSRPLPRSRRPRLGTRRSPPHVSKCQ